MENQLSEILDNLLGMLLLEGSYEIEENDESFLVSIETKDAGRLIGARGESLDALQLLVNQMVARLAESKRARLAAPLAARQESKRARLAAPLAARQESKRARKVGEEGLVLSPSTSGESDSPSLGINSVEGFKRVVIDVGGWREQKEEDLAKSAQSWGKQVLESGRQLELEPQSPWQRRIVHMAISGMEGVESESVGEGRDRHIVIKLADQKTQKDSEKSEDQKV